MPFKTSSRKRSLLAGSISLLSALLLVPVSAFEAKDAGTLYEAHVKAFYQERGESAVLKESTEGSWGNSSALVFLHVVKLAPTKEAE